MVSNDILREIVKIPVHDYYDSIEVLDSKPALGTGAVYMVNAPLIGRFQVFMRDTGAADLYWKPYDFEKYPDVHEYSVKMAIMGYIYGNVDWTGLDHEETESWYYFFWNEQERRRIPAEPDFRYIKSPEQGKKATGLSPEERARLFGA